MGAWIEISYCSAGQFGNSFSSGTIRMYEAEMALWVADRTREGKPVLITEVKAIRGSVGDSAKVVEESK